ncbi:jg20826 [Pararge aegeria aegeria]|uniref:Jg20826 protein n=1 Tax=Pararge aegeria aegeria TaxID=348720 RepID=A0A8S4R7S0_9NEOP|nr:jg20826 [Pararge aegeria aegeria]
MPRGSGIAAPQHWSKPNKVDRRHQTRRWEQLKTCGAGLDFGTPYSRAMSSIVCHSDEQMMMLMYGLIANGSSRTFVAYFLRGIPTPTVMA